MNIAALILAAGRSTRMGSHKLLEVLGDRALIRHPVDAALASNVRQVFVVTGHNEDTIRATLSSSDVRFVSNPDFAEGLSSSLKAGVRALPSSIDAAIILLGDMPLITHDLIDQMIDVFNASPQALALVPTYQGEWGNPVLIARKLFPEIETLSGDAGARKLLQSHHADVIEMPVTSDNVLVDLDTPEALAKARSFVRLGNV
ncbi:MAG: NTP transferase domain-containing protein [Hyphomicrobiales bacterium]